MLLGLTWGLASGFFFESSLVGCCAGVDGMGASEVGAGAVLGKGEFTTGCPGAIGAAVEGVITVGYIDPAPPLGRAEFACCPSLVLFGSTLNLLSLMEGYNYLTARSLVG